MSSFPDSYSESTLAKIGRNTFSSWEQTGHLAAGRAARRRFACAPYAAQPTSRTRCCSVTLQGVSGQALFETAWAQVLDQPRSHLVDLAVGASQRGMLEFRHAGGVDRSEFPRAASTVRRERLL